MIIYIIGFMGAGKTTVGKRLAKKIKFTFIDTDVYIEKKQNKTIKCIFEENGEEYFRNLEKKAIKEIQNLNGNFVISTGGGLPIFNDCIDEINNSGISLWLRASFETIINRVNKDQSRPVLKSAGSQQNIKNILDNRSEIYKKAQYIIDVDNKDIESIVTEILKISKVGLGKESR